MWLLLAIGCGGAAPASAPDGVFGARTAVGAILHAAPEWCALGLAVDTGPEPCRGLGVVWASHDAGRTWAQTLELEYTSPRGWSFVGERGVLHAQRACGGSSTPEVLRTHDAARSWTSVDLPEALLPTGVPVVLLDGVVVDQERTCLKGEAGWMCEGDGGWTAAEPPPVVLAADGACRLTEAGGAYLVERREGAGFAVVGRVPRPGGDLAPGARADRLE